MKLLFLVLALKRNCLVYLTNTDITKTSLISMKICLNKEIIIKT